MPYELGSWDLSEINPGNIDEAISEVNQKADRFKALRSTLSDDISEEAFLKIVDQYESIHTKASFLNAFAQLNFRADSSNQEASAMRSKVDKAITDVSNKLLFFRIWFQSIPEKKSSELIKASGKQKYFFERWRQLKKFSRDEREEQILTVKNMTGCEALNNIFMTLTSQFDFSVNGEKLTQNEVIKKVRDSSPEIRKAAYESLLLPYRKNQNVIGEIYKALVTDWHEENVRIRGHADSIQVRNVDNDVPDEAVEALLRVCEKNYHLFYRFFELKRKKLGLEKLRRFDMYAPTVAKSEQIPYDSAVKMVLEAYERFSPDFKNYAMRMLDKERIHSTVKKNKDPGAFCYSVSNSIDPYLLLNYTGDLRSVSTLAHELGHAVHFMLASKQSDLLSFPCLPLAETASVFGEALLTELLIERNPERAEELLFSKLDDIYATIIRQAGFVAFEKKAHDMIRDGKTINDLSEEYFKGLKKQLGPDVDIDSAFAHEWCMIPHIFKTPFYCYAYAFGNLLVLAFLDMYREQGEAFVPKLTEFLAKGGSESPVDITKAIGVDICSEEFWQKGFNTIERMINQLEETQKK